MKADRAVFNAAFNATLQRILASLTPEQRARMDAGERVRVVCDAGTFDLERLARGWSTVRKLPVSSETSSGARTE